MATTTTFTPERLLHGNILPSVVLTWALDAERQEMFADMVESEDSAVLQEIVDAYNEAHGEKKEKKDTKVGHVRGFGEVTTRDGRILLRTKPRSFELSKGRGNSWRTAALSALVNAATIARAKKDGPIATANLDECIFDVYESAEGLSYREALEALSK